MKDSVICAGNERWTVRLDVRDLGGHLDTTERAWGCTLAARVCSVLRVVWLVSALPLGYLGKLRVLRTIYMVLRLLVSLRVVCFSFGLLLFVLVGLVR